MKNIRRNLASVWMIVLSFQNVMSQTVSVYQTSSDGIQKLSQQNDRFFTETSCGGTIITIDNGVKYQTMDGFGAAMTGSSAYLMNNQMNTLQRNALMDDLFGSSGIALSFVRHSIGSSDFSLSNYTYHEPGETFSIADDTTDLIPMLLEAKNRNNDLKIMGTPWSAPAWMKTNASLFGGSLKDNHLDDFALYLVRYINAFEEKGLPIYAITMQNEPLNESSSYPSMKMEWFQQSNLLRFHLGPSLATEGLETKVLLYDHNWDVTDYAKDILSVAETEPYAAGTAFHGYAGDVSAQSEVYNHNTAKGIWFTEQSGGDWSPDFDENLDWYARNLIVGTIRNWSKSVLLWNLALDNSNGPTNGGCSNCRGVVTINDDGSYTKEIEYYILGHMSKFVFPGAYRIKSAIEEGIQNVAFENPDGSMVLIAYNTNELNKYVKFRIGEKEFKYTMPGGALTTFKWDQVVASRTVKNSGLMKAGN